MYIHMGKSMKQTAEDGKGKTSNKPNSAKVEEPLGDVNKSIVLRNCM